mgnify:CR=1 FL=1
MPEFYEYHVFDAKEHSSLETLWEKLIKQTVASVDTTQLFSKNYYSHS